MDLGALGTVVAGAGVACSVLIGFGLLFELVWDLASLGFAKARRRASSVPLARVGVSGLLVVGFVSAPLAAGRWAELRNEWADDDGNGLLDPFSNGSYDWLDINAGTTLRIWGAIAWVLLIAWALSYRTFLRREAVGPGGKIFSGPSP